MNTRFDNEKEWITENEVYEIKEMETGHILNTLRLFVIKPNSVVGMLIKDIERSIIFDEMSTPWSKMLLTKRDIKKESIRNITSMKTDEIINYVMNTPLTNSMKKELESRGVDVENSIEKIVNGDGGAF